MLSVIGTDLSGDCDIGINTIKAGNASGIPRIQHTNIPIKESEIPSTNDSIMDVGYYVVSNKLNESAASACVRVGYHNWYSCNSQPIDTQSWYHNSPKLLHDMSGPIYDDVYTDDACITDHHLKEGTKDFDFCVKMLD